MGTLVAAEAWDIVPRPRESAATAAKLRGRIRVILMVDTVLIRGVAKFS
ncbi:hypothetical protein CVA01_29480 [Corynebacterium variabile]|uniref:Uncharacterized protein n=1 Tax=Corynebacterium variabile TaxID=1727 RepID=A0A4Y4C877_9CORY|nr:hypothetical protein CVA01_29480 [Corynebacterium variabile]